MTTIIIINTNLSRIIIGIHYGTICHTILGVFSDSSGIGIYVETMFHSAPTSKSLIFLGIGMLCILLLQIRIRIAGIKSQNNAHFV